MTASVIKPVIWMRTAEQPLKPLGALTMISRYLAGLLLDLTSVASAADSSSCYNIADAKTYCLAEVR